MDEKLDQDVENELQSHYGETGSEGTTKGWDALQKQVKKHDYTFTNTFFETTKMIKLWGL